MAGFFVAPSVMESAIGKKPLVVCVEPPSSQEPTQKLAAEVVQTFTGPVSTTKWEDPKIR
jgi:hypothetical protein